MSNRCLLHVFEGRSVVTEPNTIYTSSQLHGLVIGTLMIATDQLRQFLDIHGERSIAKQTTARCAYLMVVKDDVGHLVFARHGVRPEFAHEKDLVGVFRRIFALLGFLDPFLTDAMMHEVKRVYRSVVTRTYGEMSDEIEEEVSLGYADHFVENLHEQTESFA